MKKTISFLLLFVLLFSLTACGGGNTGTSASESAEEYDSKQMAETGELSGETKAETISAEVGEIALVEFTDPDVGYTLLCPDLPSNEDGYNSYWVKDTEDYDLELLFGYCEYEEGSARYSQSPDEIGSVEELPLFFSESARDTMLEMLETAIAEYSMDDLNCETMEVSGLPALSFRGAVTDLEDVYGFTGICIWGNVRPYMFWAVDVTEGMSLLDTAAEVLSECVVNFAEGQ